MATFTEGPRRSFKAAADLSAKKYHVMKQTADNEVNIASSATDAIIGVLSNTPVQDEDASVYGFWGGGTFLVKAGGSISRGAQLTANSDGKAVATTTEDDVVFGIALQAADDGDIFEYAPVYLKVPPTS